MLLEKVNEPIFKNFLIQIKNRLRHTNIFNFILIF